MSSIPALSWCQHSLGTPWVLSAIPKFFNPPFPSPKTPSFGLWLSLLCPGKLCWVPNSEQMAIAAKTRWEKLLNVIECYLMLFDAI